jgi:HTH-type transcriptional regulator/antitoxin HigA
MERKAMNAATTIRGGAMDRYLELVQQFPLRPIRSKAEYKRALRIVDGFAVSSEGSLASGVQDYFETLVLLVEAYESKNEHVDTSSVDPIEVLKHLMEEHEMKSSDLGKLIGSKGIASEILNGKRELSKAHIVKLAEHFSVDASVFFPLPKR